jgi:hypothetical protein
MFSTLEPRRGDSLVRTNACTQTSTSVPRSDTPLRSGGVFEPAVAMRFVFCFVRPRLVRDDIKAFGQRHGIRKPMHGI